MPMVSMLENQSCFVHFRSCAKVGRCQTQRCLRCLFPKSRPKFLSFTCGLERKTQSNAQHLRSKKCVMLRTPTTGRGQPLANHSKASCTQHSFYGAWQCHHIAPWSWSRKGRAGGPFNDGLVAVRWRCGKSMRLENEKNWNSASGLCFRLRLCLWASWLEKSQHLCAGFMLLLDTAKYLSDFQQLFCFPLKVICKYLVVNLNVQNMFLRTKPPSGRIGHYRALSVWRSLSVYLVYRDIQKIPGRRKLDQLTTIDCGSPYSNAHCYTLMLPCLY